MTGALGQVRHAQIVGFWRCQQLYTSADVQALGPRTYDLTLDSRFVETGASWAHRRPAPWIQVLPLVESDIIES